jgi:hypothetical protein
VNSCGSSDRGGKDAAQIEERNGLAKRKDDKPWSVADSVNSPSGLENFGGTRINIRRAIEDGSALLGRGGIARVWHVVIPSGSTGSETAELIPARWMRTGGEVDTRKRRVRRQRDGLRRDIAERSDPWWLRKFAHER